MISSRLAFTVMRLQGASLLLVALLQRAPLVRVLLQADSIFARPIGAQLLRAATAVGLYASAVDTVAGATQLVTNPSSPAAATVGSPFSAAFAVTGAPLIPSSYTVSGLPPGLSVTGGTLVSGSYRLNSSSGMIAGTPTTAGSFVATITAWEFGNANGRNASYGYQIDVGGAAAAPTITTGPATQTVAFGGSVAFTVAASGSPPLSYQWLFNDSPIPGATAPRLEYNPVSATHAGQYSVRVTNSGGTTTSARAILGLTIDTKVSGSGSEFSPNIRHPNGNIYDQFLLSGSTVFIRADAGQAVRVSFIDLTDDIVQVEFSGAGTLMIAFDSATGPARPTKYNQAIDYMRGHARIVLSGADQTTNLTVFSVGRMTAFDPTGAWNPTQPISATNDPANSGNPLFTGFPIASYDAFADLASISITSTNGRFGGLRTANASYFATSGLTGVLAPGVEFTGPVFIGDINASDSATPVILLGSASDVRITGGDLLQSNSRAVAISGFSQLRFAAGQNSHGVLQSAQANRARLERDGVDVTSSVVINP
ncbi:MAG: hypothetical protein C0502_01880 [Opitutus sp.]|nr:hypothetical protein [Opitutus sp.]